MPRYNPNNRAHRKALAKRLTKMLLSSGFTVDTSATGETVFERPVDGAPARVRVLTSIVNGECRQKGADAIRVCAVLDHGGETRGLVKSTRVNRTGDQDGITGRVLAAMRKTYSLARKRANDPSFLALPAKPAKQDLSTFSGSTQGEQWCTRPPRSCPSSQSRGLRGLLPLDILLTGLLPQSQLQ